MPTLTVSAPTILKRSPVQSALLGADEKASLAAGDYPILAYADATDSHIVVTFDPAKNDLAALHPSGRNTWHLYSGHAAVEGNLPGNNPKDAVIKKVTKGTVVAIAGLGPRGLLSPVDGCQNFTWAELTKGGSRMPANASVSKHMVGIAKALEQARTLLGDRSFIITSGYRPPAVNAAIGGASGSRHTVGDAVDFAVPGMRPKDVYAALNPWWGSRGGLAYGRGFTHIDLRGYRARWQYPGA
ncbi:MULTISPECIES: D-Ala-D-Ala carboxypeptidase family metallohydrolase [Cyanophyceae]|uniref:YcbK family protein n=1 Tax=Cyanophyceae TaxID=3028117 RepID=UPI0016827D76|nr:MULTISPECIES: D-Ala-D-Ala carboxypeptidase family metallohydrolase [Cyanophyceae]MBD1918850.1 DUF882 domain-containing protein [Phormidium sp. FACHB-77]MBD2033307.1 DUF882 domain-containing protein [Phormidium sp. FACHB-322]MBD2053760.1 DUF882 domain-containing protein [Leptolyngbya sp. FACHB-60]